MDTFSSRVHVPEPPPALDSVDVLRALEGLLPQWPSALQQSFLPMARDCTAIAALPVGARPLAGGLAVAQTARCARPAPDH
jgi:hypothetical protein